MTKKTEHEIHIMSGLGSSIFPFLRKGTMTLEKLVDKLDGIDAQHHIWDDWEDIYDRLMKLHTGRALAGRKVCVIGHSNGVLGAAKLAAACSKAGIQIDYIAAIDPTAASFPAFDHNVLTVEEFWASSGWPAFTRRITGGRNGQCHFVKGWDGKYIGPRKYKSSHIALASNPLVHQAILKQIKERI